jgi:hypothetical protein
MGDDWFDLNNIVSLQRILINDLSGNTSVDAQRAINNVALTLSDLSTSINESSVSPTLTHQEQVNTILERENNRLVDRKKAIDQAETGQKRLVDLTTNATLRNKAINKMYVVITIAILCYLGIRVLVNSGMVPEKITDILFIILVTGSVIMLINMYYDHERRNNMDYNMIDLGEPKQLVGTSADSKTASGKNLLESRFNGCVKDACCSDGTSFNDKYSICVPNLPPFDSTGTINNNNYAQYKYFIASKSWENADTKCGVDKYSSTELACGNTVAGFTTISATSDYAKPNNPSEMVDYNLYK